MAWTEMPFLGGQSEREIAMKCPLAYTYGVGRYILYIMKYILEL